MTANTREDGCRLRELRVSQRKSLRVVAGLAGISEGHLSRLERGERPLDRRSLVLALAEALQVSPADITGQPYPPSDHGEAVGHAAAPMLRAVLRDVELGELATSDPLRPLEQLRAEVELANTACIASDYGMLGSVIPGLFADLHEHAEARPEASRGAVRLLLVQVLHNAFYLAKDLGHGDLGWMVASHLHRTATALGEPVWGALAEFVRGHAVIGDRGRERALMIARRGADALPPDDGEAGQVYGMLHLSAALQAASLHRVDDSRDHLAEAADTAVCTGEGSFGGLMFGPTNVGIWRVALAVELGEGARVAELAQAVDVDAIPSAGRQATFYGDLGRGLAQERGREAKAVEALRRAENLAAQRVRNNPYVRAVVIDLLPRTSGRVGRELRGMAYRMGIRV